MIRLIRILEYEFKDNATAQQNMSKFGVPANGEIQFGENRIRSATITNLDADSLYEDGKKFQETMDLIANDSLARDGWEMIEAAARDKGKTI